MSRVDYHLLYRQQRCQEEMRPYIREYSRIISQIMNYGFKGYMLHPDGRMETLHTDRANAAVARAKSELKLICESIIRRHGFSHEFKFEEVKL